MSIDARAIACQEGAQRTIQKIIRWIRTGLITDQKRREEEAGRTIDSILASEPPPPLVIDAWVMMWGCYRDAADRPPSPARISLESLTAERADLYAHVLPLRRPISIKVFPFLVDDNNPGEEDIDEEVMRLRLHCVGGPSEMRAEQLRL